MLSSTLCDESAYPREYGFVLRQLQRAASASDVRRFMEGEDQLLRDSISWGRQADYQRQRADREGQRADREGQRADREGQRADREGQRADRAEQALSRSIRQLHGLGQAPDAIAAALSIDMDEVRRVLAASDDGAGTA